MILFLKKLGGDFSAFWLKSSFKASVKTLFKIPIKKISGRGFYFASLFGSSFLLTQFAFGSSLKAHETPLNQLNKGGGVDFLAAVLSAGIVVQITFLILIVMSVVSWAIIIQKWFFFKEMEKNNLTMNEVFLKDGSFDEIYIKAKSNEKSPLAQIFISGYHELKKICQNQTPVSGSASASASDSDSEETSSTQLKGLDNIERVLNRALENELSLMESSLGFLATVGSSGPFIGLFGTVFGIMSAFQDIARMESAGLNVVAPGIAEALLATGVGLFAAIPASVFYNSYLSHIKKFDLQLNNFAVDFLNIAKRNFFKEEA